jgi:hypothetical protein
MQPENSQEIGATGGFPRRSAISIGIITASCWLFSGCYCRCILFH